MSSPEIPPFHAEPVDRPGKSRENPSASFGRRPLHSGRPCANLFMASCNRPAPMFAICSNFPSRKSSTILPCEAAGSSSAGLHAVSLTLLRTPGSIRVADLQAVGRITSIERDTGHDGSASLHREGIILLPCPLSHGGRADRHLQPDIFERFPCGLSAGHACNVQRDLISLA